MKSLFPPLALAGRISKTHGYKGEVKVVLGEGTILTNPKGLVFIEHDKKPVPYFLEKISAFDTEFIAKLERIDSETEAKDLLGRNVFVEAKYIKQAKGKFEEDQLIGLAIVDQSGKEIGKVLSVQNYNQVLLETKVNGKEVLLPLNEETLIKLEIKKQKIHLMIPEGLVEFYLGE